MCLKEFIAQLKEKIFLDKNVESTNQSDVKICLRYFIMICCGTNTPLYPFHDKMTSTAHLELSLEQSELVYYSGDRIRGALVVHVGAPITIAGEWAF